MKHAWIAIAVATAALALGCPGQRPCLNCPTVEGTYEVVAEDPVQRTCADAGTIASGVLVLTQGGGNRSSLEGTYAGIPVSGVVYQSEQLSVSGSIPQAPDADAGIPAGLDSVNLFGKFVGATPTDPAQIRGDLTVNWEQDGGVGPCSVVAPFEATKK